MKKLGLIGGTGPESTLIYYKQITGQIQKVAGNFPRMTIESLSVYDVLDFCAQKDYDGLARYMLSGFKALKNAGCDFAALTGITPHIVYDRLAAESPIPIVSMVNTSLEYAMQKGYHRLALLGTGPTMAGDFFKAPFRAHGLEVVVPREEEQALIHSRISTELELGIVTDDTVKALQGIAERMIREDGADAVILGCTELPPAFGRIPLPVEKMDVMQIHIQALCRIITE